MAFFKNKCQKLWIWIAFDPISKRVLSFEVGGRGYKTAKQLFAKLNKTCKVTTFATDDWKVYKKIIPTEKHLIGKKYTTHIENFNSQVRHFLARFRRKGKCYSKSKEMLEYSLRLLMLKWNNELSILG